MSSLPEAVLRAVERRWSVIPVGLDKKPFFKWAEFQRRRASPDELLAWQKQFNPPAQAVVTGQISDLIIVDFDGSQGRTTMARLGLTPNIRTQSGGFHCYFPATTFRVSTVNGKSKTALGKLYPGTDLRADGGYAVFHGRGAHGDYEFFSAEPGRFDSMPQDLRQLLGLTEPQKRARQPRREEVLFDEGKPNGSGAPPSMDLPFPDNPEYLINDGGLLTAALKRTLEGEGRNDAGFRLAVAS